MVRVKRKALKMRSGTCNTQKLQILLSYAIYSNDFYLFTLFILSFLCVCYQTVIFIRDKNPHGQEISGYIDYAHRLKIEDFEVYFSGKRRLLPKPTDLR